MRDFIFVALFLSMWTLGMLFGGFLMGVALMDKATDRIRSDAYVQGAMDCEQFHKAQAKRDELQGVRKTSGRIQ